MKKRFIVGIDISCKKLNIAVIDLQTGKIEEFEIENSRKEITKFLKRKLFEKKSIISIVIEATGTYGLHLIDIAHLLEFDICVLNPLIIRRYSEMKMYRAKTDKFDAKIIAEYGKENLHNLLYSKPKAKELEEAISIQKLIEDYQQVLYAQNNRLKAVIKNPNVHVEVIKSLKREIQRIAKEIKKLSSLAFEIIENFDKELFTRLKRICGVGNSTALMIISHFGKFENFETPKQVSSFAGINPKPFLSGSSVNKRGGISKKGRPFIRKILYMAALSAKEHNASCKEMYNRLLLKGKSKKTAIVAVANKLLRQIFAVVKFEREWSNNYKSCSNLT